MRRRGVDLTHAGGGTLLILNYVALIPGVIPTLVLTALLLVVLVLPVVVVGLAALVVLGPLYGIWRTVSRVRPGARRTA